MLVAGLLLRKHLISSRQHVTIVTIVTRPLGATWSWLQGSSRVQGRVTGTFHGGAPQPAAITPVIVQYITSIVDTIRRYCSYLCKLNMEYSASWMVMTNTDIIDMWRSRYGLRDLRYYCLSFLVPFCRFHLCFVGLVIIALRCLYCQLLYLLYENLAKVWVVSRIVYHVSRQCWGLETEMMNYVLTETKHQSGCRVWHLVLEKVPSEGSQARRRPLLGPSPGWKRLLPLSHLRHY